MFNVFIRKIPHAIKLFEEIINSFEFFKYVICQTEKFNSLRRVYNLAGSYIITDTFTEYIIIPAIWNKYIPKIFDAEFDPKDGDDDFFYSLIEEFRERFPLKINFDEKIISMVRYIKLEDFQRN